MCLRFPLRLAGTLHQCTHGHPVIITSLPHPACVFDVIPRHPRCHQPPSNRSVTCGTRLPCLSRCLPSLLLCRISCPLAAVFGPKSYLCVRASHWQDSLHTSPQPVPTSQHHQALPPSTAPNAGPRPRRRRVLGPARLMACPSPWLCLVLVRVPVAKPRINLIRSSNI